MIRENIEESIEDLEMEMRRVFDLTELIKDSLSNMKNEAGNLVATMNQVSLINNLNMIFDARKLKLCED